MKDYFGFPGPGGSLGECAICGRTFLAEILLGQTVPTFTVSGCEQTLFCHRDKCLDVAKQLSGKSIEECIKILPGESRLRSAMERAIAEAGEAEVVA